MGIKIKILDIFNAKNIAKDVRSILILISGLIFAVDKINKNNK